MAVALTVWGYVAIGPNGRLEPGRAELHKTDFTVFTEAGAAFFDGRDPYRVTNARGWHYLYPPLFALLVAPLSVFDTESQVVAWYVVNVLLSIGCFVEARWLWRFVSGSEPHRTALGGWLRAPGRVLAIPRLYAIRATGHRDSLLSHVGFPSRHSRAIAFDLVSRRSRAGTAGGRQARAVLARRIPSLPALVGGGETTHRAKALGTGDGI